MLRQLICHHRRLVWWMQGMGVVGRRPDVGERAATL
jgi:hypothetical protein